MCFFFLLSKMKLMIDCLLVVFYCGSKSHTTERHFNYQSYFGLFQMALSRQNPIILKEFIA